MADPKPATADSKLKTLKATVAKGRTITLPGEVIRDNNGVATGSLPGADYGPGDEVEVEEAEARRLMAAGFLNNPDAPAPVISTGPKIQMTEDPKKG
jgi:hypothetical protein